MNHIEDELSLKDIIYRIKEFYLVFKSKWLTVVIIAGFTSMLGLLYSFYKKPQYLAVSTMMLETSGGGSMSGALALASQFGLMGGGNSSAAINEDKLIDLIKAETIITTALFRKANIDGKTDILANHFIDLFGYKKIWEVNDSLKDFRFTNQKDNLSLLENKVLKIFCSKIKLSNLSTDKSKSGIITVTTNTKSELFSQYFNQYLVEAVTSFYVNRITQKGRLNVDIIQNRVDSIAVALKNAEFALAKWKDGNFQLVKAQGMIAEMQLRRNVEINNSIYIEGIKQLEISKFALLQDTPFLQIIDKPMLPLEPIGRVSPLKGGLGGFVSGFLLSVIYIFARKKYVDLMAEEQL